MENGRQGKANRHRGDDAMLGSGWKWGKQLESGEFGLVGHWVVNGKKMHKGKKKEEKKRDKGKEGKKNKKENFPTLRTK